jgi:glutathione S-transferase
MEKITKREMFEAIKEAFETGSCKLEADVVMAFCDKEIAALDSKAAKAKERAAAKKAEADVLMDQVRDVLTGEFQTIADIAAAVAEVNADATVSKVTYRLTKLVEAGDAEKTDVSIPGGEGVKARKVKAFRAIEA